MAEYQLFCFAQSGNAYRAALMLNLIKNLVRKDEGQDLAEYGIALAVIAIGAALIAVAIGTDVQTLWSNAQEVITSAVNAEA